MGGFNRNHKLIVDKKQILLCQTIENVIYDVKKYLTIRLIFFGLALQHNSHNSIYQSIRFDF